MVDRSDSSKTALLLLDQCFTETASALGHYITFSRTLFPTLFLMVGLMGFLISRLMVKRMEFTVMWGLCHVGPVRLTEVGVPRSS